MFWRNVVAQENIQDALAKKCARRNQIFRHKIALLDDCEHRPGYCPGRKSCWNTKQPVPINSARMGPEGTGIRLPFHYFPYGRDGLTRRFSRFDWRELVQFTTSGGMPLLSKCSSETEKFGKPCVNSNSPRAGQRATPWALYGWQEQHQRQCK